MPRFKLILTVACGLWFAAQANAQSLQQELDTAIQSEIETSGIPSLQVAVGLKGDIIFEGARGAADIENEVAATVDTRYRSASISKWFTATAAMMLAEHDKLALDESVQQYCPSFPDKRKPITTRQLLTHTSGIRHYADYEGELSRAESDEERAAIERRQLRSELATFRRYADVIGPLENFRDDPLVFEPGEDWLYSSFGYRLLGCVIAGAADRSYSALLDEIVFEPTGMVSTVPDDAWAIIPGRAAGYRLDRGAPLRRADMRDVSENLPAGGHLTTASDLVAFAMAFQAGDLASEESKAVMLEGLSSEPGVDENYTSWRHAIPSRGRYSYGLMSFPNEDQLWIGHTGRQAGASSIVVLVPESDLAIAVLTNTKGWGGYLGFVRRVHEIVERHIQQKRPS